MSTGHEPDTRPKYLYKYRALGESETFTKSIVTKSEIWFSRPSRFNDPFDCNLHVPWSRSGAELATRVFDRLWPSGNASAEPGAEHRGRPRLAGDAAQGTGEPTREKARAALTTLAMGVLRELLEGGIKIKATWTDRQGHTTDIVETVNEQRESRVFDVKEKLDAAVGVLTLSESPEQILLWSHYADDHKGICLEFDVERCASQFPRLQPVRYSSDAPSVSASFPELGEKLLALGGKRRREIVLDVASLITRASRRQQRDVDEEQVLASAVADLDSWFYTKSVWWAYEREWRSLAGAEGAVSFPPDALTGIVGGCVETDETLEKVRRWLVERGAPVPLRRAHKKEGQFAIEILPVT